MQGEPISMYRVGTVAAAYQPRIGMDAKRYQGPIQATIASPKQVKIAGIWFPIARVWKPIDPKTVSTMAYGTRLWGCKLELPIVIEDGSFAGWHYTNLGRIVLCIWKDYTRTDPVGTFDGPSPDYERIHVENVALHI